jgi:hypothetical protein
MDQHFYNGFIKRAQQYGLTAIEAERLIKVADERNDNVEPGGIIQKQAPDLTRFGAPPPITSMPVRRGYSELTYPDGRKEIFSPQHKPYDPRSANEQYQSSPKALEHALKRKQIMQPHLDKLKENRESMREGPEMYPSVDVNTLQHNLNVPTNRAAKGQFGAGYMNPANHAAYPGLAQALQHTPRDSRGYFWGGWEDQGFDKSLLNPDGTPDRSKYLPHPTADDSLLRPVYETGRGEYGGSRDDAINNERERRSEILNNREHSNYMQKLIEEENSPAYQAAEKARTQAMLDHWNKMTSGLPQ